MERFKKKYYLVERMQKKYLLILGIIIIILLTIISIPQFFVQPEKKIIEIEENIYVDGTIRFEITSNSNIELLNKTIHIYSYNQNLKINNEPTIVDEIFLISSKIKNVPEKINGFNSVTEKGYAYKKMNEGTLEKYLIIDNEKENFVIAVFMNPINKSKQESLINSINFLE